MCYRLWCNAPPWCCRPKAGNIVRVHYTTSCNTQSSAPEDGQNNCPEHVELIGIINKSLLFHLVGCLYYLYQCCTVKQISYNEIYLLFKYIKSVLWRTAKRLSYIEGVRSLKVNLNWHLKTLFLCQFWILHKIFYPVSQKTQCLYLARTRRFIFLEKNGQKSTNTRCSLIIKLPKFKVFVHPITIVLLRWLKGHRIIIVYWNKQMGWNQGKRNWRAEIKIR